MAVNNDRQILDISLYFWEANKKDSDRLKIRLTSAKITKKAIDELLAQYKEFLYSKVLQQGTVAVQKKIETNK